MFNVRTIIAMSLVVAFCDAAGAQNLIANGDFETGDTSFWGEVVLSGDPAPEFPEWNVLGWGAPEGMFFAMTFNDATALYQEIEPTPSASITDLSFYVLQEVFPPDPGDDELRTEDELRVGLVCRFADPSGEAPFIQGVSWLSMELGQLTLYDGLGNLQSLASEVEGAGPAGPVLLGVGIVGQENASTITDGWTLMTPEPGTICLLGLGICVLFRGRRS